MNKKTHKYQKVNIQGFKHDGTLYRQWNNAIVIADDDEKLVLYLYRAKVQDIKDRKYSVTEPSIWFFYKKHFFNALYLLRPTGNFLYINMSSPYFFEDNTVKYIDYDLDLKDYADKELEIVDITEFKANKVKYNYSNELVNILFKEVNTLLDWKEQHKDIFNQETLNNYVSNLANDCLLLFKEKKLKYFANQYLRTNRLKTLVQSKHDNIIKLYTCGPTVYDSPHIGNMRPVLTSHIFAKANLFHQKAITFVHNITDIDDKIIQRADEEGVHPFEISQKYSREYVQLLKKYGIRTITHLVYVTKSLVMIKGYLNKLLKSNKVIYEDDGVLLDISKVENYGKNVNRDKDIDYEEANFYLWKQSDIQPLYSFNKYTGRPGWHTECAAFINNYFHGETIDYHGGGMDLKFPHHENENAQHQAIYGKDITKNWMHTGQIFYENKKMSKSLGNIIKADDFEPDIFKLIILGTKISAPINLNNVLIKQQENIIKKYKKIIFEAMLYNCDRIVVDDTTKEAVNHLVELNFQKYLFSIDKLISNYNKSLNKETLKHIYTLINLMDFNWHDHLRKNKIKFLELYRIWKIHHDNQDYIQADEYREMLLSESLI
ncbi:hypothetical protein CJJ23_03860 [Mycoplasmopsis agassizii]|uniref:Cysteine--tRNA ligase n=1 Tax=Mycoplasmopsis agassizii TaxID=33922 RepID=A0A269TJN9_9BACT|nr:DUF402 domain-containing protein [Mycoplasmopsis agassizii]PAK21108.1 hypothetical protein CJJ23_03860 [Mycoplasmopsis agassizii]